jgi:hypothetical protein
MGSTAPGGLGRYVSAYEGLPSRARDIAHHALDLTCDEWRDRAEDRSRGTGVIIGIAIEAAAGICGDAGTTRR